MAATITREMVKQYKVADGGSIPNGLYIAGVPDFIPIVKRSDTVLSRMVKTGPAKDLLIWPYGEGDLAPITDQLAEALDASETGVDVDSGAKFQLWDQIRVDEENMLVTAFATANTLTVTRGFGGTTAATHADDSKVKILGPAVPEGVDAPDSPVAKGETFETYPQIMEYTWKHSHRGRVTPNYEVKTDAFKHEMAKKMKEAAIDLDLLMLYSYKAKGAGDLGAAADEPSAMGGLLQATSTNVTDLNGAPWTLYDLMTGLDPAYQDVGSDMALTAMGNIFWKFVFNSWFQPSRRTSGRDDSLSITWDSVETEYGTIRFVVNHRMEKSDGVVFWSPEDARRHPYEGGNWSTGLYSTQGWYDKGFLRGDFGVIWQADRRRTRFVDMSTTVTDYPNLHVPA